ncbi:hypothetical protein BDZ45DRAFT_686328 [Acephala macrosclerotiorum]|nr:hypothetical protein BDZ45DRAFT_686328 [Acephala macrosclerotiorum]
MYSLPSCHLHRYLPTVVHPSARSLQDTEKSCRESTEPGQGNINNEKVFISATLYDAKGILVGGEWGNAIKERIHLLGPDNVHLSVYENDPDPLAQQALEGLGKQISLSEHLPLEEFPRVTLLNSETRIKRIAFLAKVRNRALRPIELDPSIKFDKLLFVNDTTFNPTDAVQLLFCTHADESGHTQYGVVRNEISKATLWVYLSFHGSQQQEKQVGRLYPFIRNALNRIAGLPVHNPRRLEQPGDEVMETVWEYDETGVTPTGLYRKVERKVGPGRFCGSRTLQVLNEDPKKGEPKWIIIEPPALPD